MMKQFYELFPENENVKQVAAKLFFVPWGHMILILTKAKKDQKKALFFIDKVLEHNWSRAVLSNFLDTNLYEREGRAPNNFELTLPKENSDLAREIVKDPYSFDFLAMTDGFKERELKNALVKNIRSFLLELGSGFAYMGQEYRLEIGDTDLYLDLLFYNVKIHAYVVVEVKGTGFKPEHVGQLGTYVAAVNHLLKTERDERTIGLLICKGKNEMLAKYSLESCNEPLGISSFELSSVLPKEYESSLPTIEEIEKGLKG